MNILVRSGIQEGLLVDLSCGSGLWARELIGAGYHVLGIDISEAMIEIARRKVPEAEFRVGSLFEADIPACYAVTAVSEVLSYLFDTENGSRWLIRLFRRVYQALVPGGVFVFDVVGPGQVSRGPRPGDSPKVRLGGARRGGGGPGAGDVDPPDRQLSEGRGALQAGRRSAPSAVIQAVGDRRRIASSGLSGPDDARLRLLPSAEGSRGVRCTQTGLRARWDRRFAEEV
jgi:SAM-dependent methyltransferase